MRYLLLLLLFFSSTVFAEEYFRFTCESVTIGNTFSTPWTKDQERLQFNQGHIVWYDESPLMKKEDRKAGLGYIHFYFPNPGDMCYLETIDKQQVQELLNN